MIEPLSWSWDFLSILVAQTREVAQFMYSGLETKNAGFGIEHSMPQKPCVRGSLIRARRLLLPWSDEFYQFISGDGQFLSRVVTSLKLL
jgi:hypothetical protein